ncbi:DMT family transporter [Rhodophyticola sp. CCM32]|uniref:DMT family transporter n=1 Tax=Rhodophyticola sp. CCM32 TaxID=2916397 RepID=UPI00107F7766|nr:DMT family transporter [Rhodophyticola sp. CCM32]QBY00509.1 DMT family transporter [Rhodophyticola sp. CCM32]
MTSTSTVSLSLLLVVLWAANWPATQLALEDMPPITFRLITLLGGALALYGLCARSGERLSVPRNQWVKLTLLALLNVGIFNVLSAYAIALLEGGRAAIIAFTMPVWVTIIEALLGTRITGGRVLSIFTGVIGLSIVAYSVATDASYEPVSAILMSFAAFCWAVGSVWLSRSPLEVGAKPTAMWMMIISALAVAFLFPLQVEPVLSFPVTLAGWSGLLFATVIGMAFCQSLWFSLLDQLGSIRAAYILLAIPPVGVFLSWFIANAQVTVIDAIGLSFLLIAALISAMFRDPEPHTAIDAKAT